jgi:hypothetical protein
MSTMPFDHNWQTAAQRSFDHHLTTARVPAGRQVGPLPGRQRRGALPGAVAAQGAYIYIYIYIIISDVNDVNDY